VKAGWEAKSIATFAKTGAGGTPKKSTKAFYEGGDIPWLLSGEVANANIVEAKNFITAEGLKGSSAKLFPANSVLVAMYGATAGEVGVLRFEAATNQAVCAVLPSDQHIPEYLYYYLLHAKPSLVAQAVGNAQPNISQAKIKSLEIPLPPLEEQQRIVAVLDDAFEGLARARAHAEANLQNARELFERSAAMIFEESAANDNPQKFLVGELALPEKGSIRTGPFGSQLKHSEFVDEGISVLGIDNAVQNEFRWGKARFITEEKYEGLKRYTVKPRDVIITIMGTCGRCAIIPDDIPTAVNTKHLCCISLDQSKCLPEFLHRYFLHSPKGREYLSAQASGSVMDGLNMGIIKSMPVDVPPLERQQIIADKLSEIDGHTRRLAEYCQSKIQDLNDLRQSLLQKAFAGELTESEAEPA